MATVVSCGFDPGSLLLLVGARFANAGLLQEVVAAYSQPYLCSLADVACRAETLVSCGYVPGLLDAS